MADSKQLAKLKHNVELWNEWRSRYKNVKIDLSRADLFDSELSGADLSGADLTEADLQGADLRSANLNDANLTKAKLGFDETLYSNSTLGRTDLEWATLERAKLDGAILREANLTDAKMSYASLKHADLRWANLSQADLRGANLTRANLHGADLHSACLVEANLSKARLWLAHITEADLQKADLSDAHMDEVDFSSSNLSEACLSGSWLRDADFRNADLTGADLKNTELGGALLVHTKIDKASISGSAIYSVNVWDIEGEFAEQKDLIITPPIGPGGRWDEIQGYGRPEDAPIITVDNIKIAQFIYLILNNEEIRDVINTLTSKTVLVLGRFGTPERKMILDALRNKLREYNLLPIVFDFERPTDKDFTETIKTLAGLSFFVIADVTNPKSSPLELQATVPDYQIPFVPIIQEGEQPFAMMVDLQKKYPWVLDTLTYRSVETLIKALKPAVIDPAIKKHNELRIIKAREPRIVAVEDFIDDKGMDSK